MSEKDLAACGLECATFGAGHFYSTEYHMTQLYKDVKNAFTNYSVGFMSHDPKAPNNPTFEQVDTGKTSYI